MDFKALLQAEINRKRQKVESKDILTPNKLKYFKRGDLTAKEEEEYWKRQKRGNDKKQESPETEKDTQEELVGQSEEKVPQLARKEVFIVKISDAKKLYTFESFASRKSPIRRLRERHEPIRLSGESDYEAYLRLKRLETDGPDAREEGFRNEFKAAMDNVDEDYFKEMVEAATSGEGGKKSNDVSIKDDGYHGGGHLATLYSKMKEEIGKGDSGKNSDIILRFLKYLLKMWRQTLNERTEEEKRTLKGKEASAIHTQTVSYLKPLFRNLKHKVQYTVSYLKPLLRNLKHKVQYTVSYLKPLFRNLKHKVQYTVSYLKPLFRNLKHKVQYTVSYLKPLFRNLKHKVQYTVSYLKPLLRNLKHKVQYTVSYLKLLFRNLKHKVQYTVSYLKPVLRNLKHKVQYTVSYLKPLFRNLKHKVQGTIYSQLSKAPVKESQTQGTIYSQLSKAPVKESQTQGTIYSQLSQAPV
ncbi:pre-mRNA-splicing factor 18-like [Saccostrea cucullata]|uniref:pre-mRNA-splicing factor 18-like n=1 Tax=Saccostrea cuccullata TaxID=36930 RepID=UPI002ECFD545